MGEEKENDISNLSTFHKFIIVLALGAGAGNGIVGLNQDTSDRYKGAQARADFALRDARIRGLEHLIHEHLNHSARYTQVVEQHSHDIEELEQHVEDHVRKHLEGKRN